jgi:catechol 2,3-dioxygenase-like lactoylglutathione lyase family enzyme
MIRGLHHMGLVTSNFERMKEFYTKVLEFDVVWDGEWKDEEHNGTAYGLLGGKWKDEDFSGKMRGVVDLSSKIAFLSGGNIYIELVEYSKAKSRDAAPLRVIDRGYTHLCLDVTDIESVCTRMLDAGMPTFSAPVERGTHRAAFGRDPDGNLIEILQLTEKNLPFHSTRLGRLVD